MLQAIANSITDTRMIGIEIDLNVIKDDDKDSSYRYIINSLQIYICSVLKILHQRSFTDNHRIFLIAFYDFLHIIKLCIYFIGCRTVISSTQALIHTCRVLRHIFYIVQVRPDSADSLEPTKRVQDRSPISPRQPFQSSLLICALVFSTKTVFQKDHMHVTHIKLLTLSSHSPHCIGMFFGKVPGRYCSKSCNCCYRVSPVLARSGMPRQQCY